MGQSGLSGTEAEFGIELDATGSLLERLGQEPAVPLKVVRIGNGQSNVTLLLIDQMGQRWVLRRPPLGVRLDSAHDMAREHRVLAALGPTSVPTPAVFGMGAGPDGVDLLIMEWVDGMVLDRAAVAEMLPPGTRRAVGYSMVQTLAHLHSINPDDVGLGDLASRRPYAERQLSRWSRQWDASHTHETPLVEELAERLRGAIPLQTEVRIVHGDFSLSNVIVDPRAASVRAVLDWELCTLGDPLADVGALLAYWTQPAAEKLLPNDATTVPGFPSGDQLVAAYCEATGRDPAAVVFWHALALWKLAIIGEGVRRRALDDQRNADRTGIPGPELVEGLIARANRVADGGL